MPLSDYLVGFAWFAATFGAVCVAAWLIMRHRLAALAGEMRVLAFAVVVVAGVGLVHLVPLMLGILTRATPLLTALAAVAAAVLLPGRAPVPDSPAAQRADVPDDRISGALAAVAVAAAAVAVLALVAVEVSSSFVNVDTASFHLPNVARWIQTGTVWQIDQFLPDQAQGYYPNTGDLVLLATVLPWHNDFAVRFLAVPLLALTGLAVYALARELRASRSAAAIFAAVVVTLPVVAKSAIESELPDTVLYFSFATGLAFLARHARTRAWSDLVVAGMSLGLAFGTKWYGVSSVIVAVVVWAAARALARRPWLREGIALAVLVACTGGIWLVRNVVESGNPVFPAKLAPFGATIFDAPRDTFREASGFSIAHYLGDSHVWRTYLIPVFKVSFGFALLLLAAGVGLALALGLAGRIARLRLSSPPRPVIAAAVCAVALGIAYLVTPYSAAGSEGFPSLALANTRYGVPAVVVAAAVAAWLAGPLGRWRRVWEVLALVAVADGIRRGFDVGAAHVALGILVFTGGAVTVWFVLTGVRRARSAWTLLAPAALACLVAAVGLGYAAERRFNDHRYPVAEPVINLIAHAPGRHRIGIAGDWTDDGTPPILPAFGPRLANKVAYVGRFRRGMLRRYDTRAEFVRALRLGRYDVLVIGRGVPPRPRVAVEGWARAARYRQIAADRRLAVYQAPPGL